MVSILANSLYVSLFSQQGSAELRGLITMDLAVLTREAHGCLPADPTLGLGTLAASSALPLGQADCHPSRPQETTARH